ncbi:unnamed protein product [Clavelina lepadiformis]|uniref:Acyl-coenzyme A diphosphatase NUDT19 n=2 Tax=Clavelina lepadiformis TaxID=159417 RepID=A0ABP0GFI8_CLALP
MISSIRKFSTNMIHKASTTWFDASSVILTTPQNGPKQLQQTKTKDPVDFSVVMLKRSSTSSFYPNAYVFPGGKVDESDFSNKWIELYHSLDKDFVSLFGRLHVNQNDGHRSPMFLKPLQKSNLPNEVAYRICAIRETFEETGILIARKTSKALRSMTSVSMYGEPHDFAHFNDAVTWRKRVHNDASQFLQLCRELECVPDIWSLHEWSNWLTPTALMAKFSKRFDTVFYTASLSKIPEYYEHDNKETTTISFESSHEVISSFKQGNITLGPPQIYELCRLMRFTTHADFAKFAAERGLQGMSRCLPIRANTIDGSALALYPGDQWYPEDTDKVGKVDVDMTYDDFLKVEPRHHNHMRFKSTDDAGRRTDVVVTCNMPYQHIKPIPETIIFSKKSML